ncbi:MAG: LON peptidase substrate-binding domain-containing protein [Rubellimicrobium sp.]|nr:LON peptidase substrate-binding domain-containing protein [Rubellimicrobium sp.]
MRWRGDLPKIIPVFPLPGALLLPRARLPLHVFEPRYLAMLTSVLGSEDRLIGMIQPEDDTDGAPLRAVGCAGRVTGFQETDDGRMMITLTGISRFRVAEELSGPQPWRRVRADWSGFARDPGGPEDDPGFDRQAFLRTLGRFMRARDLSTDWDSIGEAADETLIDALAMLLPFGPEDRQALLEAPTLAERRQILGALMEFALHGGDEGEERLQ